MSLPFADTVPRRGTVKRTAVGAVWLVRGRVLVTTTKYAVDMSGPGVAVTVDVVVLTADAGELLVLAVRRGGPPYRGRWALPGGFLEPDEDLEQAARRELAEETGVEAARMEQLATYGAPRRDPRGRTVSVAWLAVLPEPATAREGSDAAGASWKPVAPLLRPGRLAFDHRRILGDGVERVRSRLEYTNLATAFLGPEFTVAGLREVYETVWGHPLDPGNFHRKVTRTDGFVEPTGRRQSTGRGRPAELFRVGPEESLFPPLTRRSLDA